MSNMTPIPPLILGHLQRSGMCQRLRDRMGVHPPTWGRIVASGRFPRRWVEARCYDLVATVLEEIADARFDDPQWRETP